MAELSDYSGDFIPNIKYDNFSKEFLSKLLVEFARCYVVADAYWYSEVNSKVGHEIAHKISVGIWTKLLPPFEVKKILPLLNLKRNDVADAIKFWQLTPSFSSGMFDFQIELKNRNHALLTITRCPGLLRFESMEPERIPEVCHELEPASANWYAKSINPDIEVTMPIQPPRKSPNDICCQFEFKMRGK